MKRPNKCYLVSYHGLSNAGGVERVCYYINQIMLEKGYKTIIVDKSIIEQLFLTKIIKTIVGKVPGLIFPLLSSLYIFLHRRKNDLAITNGFNAPFVKSDILFIHGTMAGFSKILNHEIKFKDKILIKYEKRACQNAKVIITVSRNATKEVSRYYIKSKRHIFVLNNTVDDTIFKPISLHKYTEKNLTILYCGRLDYNKGIENMIQLASEIDSIDGFRFIIATNNENNVNLFNHFKNTEIRIGLTIREMNDFYNTGDVFYFPSLYEGFEMVTLEALCSGIPVIGNNIGAIAELVSRNEPGVEIIKKVSTPETIDQLNSIAKKYASIESKEFMHNYYASKYGIIAYKEKLNNCLELSGLNELL